MSEEFGARVRSLELGLGVSMLGLGVRRLGLRLGLS